MIAPPTSATTPLPLNHHHGSDLHMMVPDISVRPYACLDNHLRLVNVSGVNKVARYLVLVKKNVPPR